MKRNKQTPSEWVQEKLRMLREEFEKSGRWPESANQLWTDLDKNRFIETEQGDEIMFSIVISDAVSGIDIAERYPEFYRRMLKNPELFQAFLDTIEMLEASAPSLGAPHLGAADSAEPLPEMEMEVPAQSGGDERPILEWLTAEKWRATWRQSVAELTALLSGFNVDSRVAYRNDLGLLEESAAPLIRGQVTVENHDLGVLLSATWADDLEALEMQLTVALMADRSAEFPLSSLRAGVYWGEYNQSSLVNEYGQASFPPLPITAIIDETGESFKSDLQLLLYTAD